MPRTARIAPREQIYHILTKGNNREVVFKDEKDYQRYLEIVKRYKDKYRFHLYHYVLMRNHVHFVLETTENGGSLSEIMKPGWPPKIPQSRLRDLQKIKNLLQTNVLIYKNADYHDFMSSRL